MRELIGLLFLLFFSAVANAQFSDSVHHQIAFNGTGSINRTNDAVAYLLNNSLRFSLRRKSLRLNFNNNWVYGQQNNRLSNNDYISTLDFNLYKTFPHFYYWGLGNYTSSYSLKIENQVQAGIGAAYNIIDQENATLNFSDGLLYERSNIFLNDTVRDEYHTFRNSLRIQFRYKYGTLLTASGYGFLQNALNDGNDYIIRANLNLALKVYKSVSLTTAVTYNNVHRTQRENLLFTYGLVIERFF